MMHLGLVMNFVAVVGCLEMSRPRETDFSSFFYNFSFLTALYTPRFLSVYLYFFVFSVCDGESEMEGAAG